MATPRPTPEGTVVGADADAADAPERTSEAADEGVEAPPAVSARDDDARQHARAVGAAIAADVTAELAEPLRELRDRLGVLVDGIDKHVALSTGPTAYPWKQLQLLRQDIADSYLEMRRMARLAGDLMMAMRAIGGPVAELDVNREVEAAVNLVSYRVGPRTELFLDLGQVPPARASSGELMLAVAQLVLVCAESAARVDGSALSIRTRGEDDRVIVYVADNGGGAAESAATACAHVAAVAARAGGSFDGTSQEGQGSAFELRLPLA